MNLQVITDPTGRLVWTPRILPGRTHDLAAARTHRIVKTRVRLRIPTLADNSYTCAGGTFRTHRPAAPQRTHGRAEILRPRLRSSNLGDVRLVRSGSKPGCAVVNDDGPGHQGMRRGAD